METEQMTDQREIIIPRSRKKLLSALGKVASPAIGTLMVFILSLYIKNDILVETISGTITLILFAEIILVLWLTRRSLGVVYSGIPVLRVNQQGITFIDPYRLSATTTLIPWSEIAKISCFHLQNLLLTITLKDPQDWWLRSGNEHPRKFPPNRQFGGAQFTIGNGYITMQLLQQIQENYAHEIQANEIEIVPFASRFTNRSA